jgi:hypothetical protein
MFAVGDRARRRPPTALAKIGFKISGANADVVEKETTCPLPKTARAVAQACTEIHDHPPNN